LIDDMIQNECSTLRLEIKLSSGMILSYLNFYHD